MVNHLRSHTTTATLLPTAATGASRACRGRVWHAPLAAALLPLDETGNTDGWCPAQTATSRKTWKLLSSRAREPALVNGPSESLLHLNRHHWGGGCCCEGGGRGQGRGKVARVAHTASPPVAAEGEERSTDRSQWNAHVRLRRQHLREDRQRPALVSLLRPACVCAQRTHRGRALWARRRSCDGDRCLFRARTCVPDTREAPVQRGPPYVSIGMQVQLPARQALQVLVDYANTTPRSHRPEGLRSRMGGVLHANAQFSLGVRRVPRWFANSTNDFPDPDEPREEMVGTFCCPEPWYIATSTAFRGGLPTRSEKKARATPTASGQAREEEDERGGTGGAISGRAASPRD
ncbi:hypothetical protein MTO96_022252 [Rhipicephalus appendiculatus]